MFVWGEFHGFFLQWVDFILSNRGRSVKSDSDLDDHAKMTIYTENTPLMTRYRQRPHQTPRIDRIRDGIPRWGEIPVHYYPPVSVLLPSSRIATVFSLFEQEMSTPAYDPQTLDNYEPFHKEFGKKEFAIMGAFTAAFAPFGWFIGRDFVARLMCSQYEGQENSPHVLCGDGLSRCLQRPLRLCYFCS